VEENFEKGISRGGHKATPPDNRPDRLGEREIYIPEEALQEYERGRSRDSPEPNRQIQLRGSEPAQKKKKKKIIIARNNKEMRVGSSQIKSLTTRVTETGAWTKGVDE